jgi:predicted GIY-YIG superfamily endonuclease
MNSFSVYMLKCADNSIYVGHTEYLEGRLRAHQDRTFSGYTARRLPVRLIFAEDFGTRADAFRAERMIKGWRRSKKLALARGDWGLIRELAAVRSPDRHPTS